jgi:hypothetical protein
MPRIEMTVREFKEKVLATDTFNKIPCLQFDTWAHGIISEIYGTLGKKDFHSISEAAPWFASKQNIIRDMKKEYHK